MIPESPPILLRMSDSSQGDHVEALQRGDPVAWQRFMKEQGRVILAVGRRVGLPDGERDEVFQTTCLIAYRSIAQLRDPGRLSSWVYSIAYRSAIDLAKRRRSEATPTADEDPFARMSDHEPRADEVMDRLEVSLQIRESLERLGDPCRSLLEALYLHADEPSYDAISQRLSMPIGSIGPTRARCLEKLRKVLTSVSDQGRLGTIGAEPPDRAERES
ncbi:MAG: sigma-70 family RNA polymerase sigma factor [Candidatus Eisenbacteria bacterium]|uniref:Sigma-70 family RNA polymerase sigma factor n=1 Tax=Eiseniibacteriota bacterium TaxID=2212470 RepID=A0A956M2U5_UNCEI|nr:sigma-70 family RNA polymerase sigma factor [Candidatus Eisenbacteria bacterium]